MICTCFYCNPADGIIKPHPARHRHFEEITHRLLVPESLNPADIVRQISCLTCGHAEPLVEDNFIKFSKGGEIVLQRIL